MNKPKVNYFIDIGLLIAFLTSATTGIIKFPGLLNIFGVNQRLLPMYWISLIHDWSGVVMAVLVLLHLVMHWKWLVAMTKSFFKKK